MKRFTVIRIIGVLMLLLGTTLIILALVEGEKSVIQSIAGGGGAIALGGALFGMSLRQENKAKAAGEPSEELN